MTKKLEQSIITYRLDDLPLLYTIIKSLGIGKSVDNYIKVHGNWCGALPGTILELWLCYILSECDHRLSGTEEWARTNIGLLQLLSGKKKLSGQDFSDDKLGTLLDYFSEPVYWSSIETAVNSKVLGVYRLEEGTDLSTFRLDAAPMQMYGKVKQEGLLQHGYHKHHANLPQFKLKLCTLDNAVNNFAYPVCHLTVDGKVSNRGTDHPSAKRILTAFKGISLSVILNKGQFQFALMTPLKSVQEKILSLLDLNDTIYSDLTTKVELFFSDSIIIET